MKYLTFFIKVELLWEIMIMCFMSNGLCARWTLLSISYGYGIALIEGFFPMTFFWEIVVMYYISNINSNSAQIFLGITLYTGENPWWWLVNIIGLTCLGLFKRSTLRCFACMHMDMYIHTYTCNYIDFIIC